LLYQTPAEKFAECVAAISWTCRAKRTLAAVANSQNVGLECLLLRDYPPCLPPTAPMPRPCWPPPMGSRSRGSWLGNGLPQGYFRRDYWTFRLIWFSAHQALDPFRGSKDLGVKCEIIFSVCYSEKLAAFFIVHRSPKAPCEKNQLLIWRPLTHGAGPPVRLSPSFTNPLLFLVWTCLPTRPSIYARRPVLTRPLVFVVHRVSPPVAANRR